MSRRFACCGLALVLTSSPFAGAPAQAKVARVASAPHTVGDYFLLLPIKYFNTITERQKLLSDAEVVDMKNDFLYLRGFDGQPGIALALSRHAGRVVVAVREDYVDDTSFDLLRWQGGRWHNVTRTLVTGYSAQLRYEIPRLGTTIRVRRSVGKHLNEPGPRLYDLVHRS